MKLRERIEELERRVRELEQAPRQYPPVFTPAMPLTNLAQCLMCGGYHGGMQCPRSMPTC